MPRESDRHGPRLDDELAREMESLTRGAPVESRASEARTMEAPADDEPPVVSVVGGDRHAAPRDADAVVAPDPGDTRGRSELARHLRPSIFPASREDVIRCATEEHAPDELVARLSRLPARTYQTPSDVWEALGGTTEVRAHGDRPHRFGFRFDWRYRLAGAAFGVCPGRAFVEVDAHERTLRARFGFWEVQTGLDNVVEATVTGPYALAKTIGPPHVSLADRGLTFATNAEAGVCVRFSGTVRGIDAAGLVKHPAVTVTVAEPDRLVELLDDARGRLAR